MEKFQVIFVPDAEKELSELINSHPELEGLAFRYAKELSDFPPGKWVDVHFKNGEETFKSDNHVVLDIQGLIKESPKTVVITRFRLRRKA